MNLVGPTLYALCAAIDRPSARCIIVYDDLALPLGAVKQRQGGSAGGHRGVASVLEAFQSAALRRVKIGVGGPDSLANPAQYVISEIDPANKARFDDAVAVAARKAFDLVATFREPVAPGGVTVAAKGNKSSSSI